MRGKAHFIRFSRRYRTIFHQNKKRTSTFYTFVTLASIICLNIMSVTGGSLSLVQSISNTPGGSFVPLDSFPTIQKDITWSVRINLSKPAGITDFIYFGEAPDANDGPPADSYDTIKQSPSEASYIQAWFNDTLPAPYDKLERDYRHYPSSSKVWNLTVLWVPQAGSPPTTITMTWNTVYVNSSEYDEVLLRNNTGGMVANMRTSTSYVFICPANIPQHFTINARVDTTPPEILNYSPESGETGDTFVFYANVYDDVASNESLMVKVNWTQGSLSGNETMQFVAGYFMKSIILSNYTTVPLFYHFYARDTAKIPNTNCTGQYSATIIDDEAPVITSTSGSVEIGTGDFMVLWVQAVDNIAVMDTRITINGTDEEMIWNPGSLRWEYLYTAPSDSIVPHTYSFTVSDAALNSVTGDSYNITVFDNDAPVISSIFATPSFQLINEHVNLTGIVTDNILVSQVMVQISGPNGFIPVNITMSASDLFYFYNQTYPVAGVYNYSLWSTDDSGNSASSLSAQFTIFGEIQITTLFAGWNFVSLPFNQSVSKTNLFIVFEEEEFTWSEAVAENIVISSIFSWDRNSQEYSLSNNLSAGYGYWLYAHSDCELWATELTSMMSTNYVTPIMFHWNVIGIPINQPVSKTTFLIVFNGVEYNWTEATTDQNPTGQPLVLKDLFGWKRNAPQEYVLTDTLQAGYSYWMFAFYDCILKRIL